MSLTETIACSTLFVFSITALAAAALYDPKSSVEKDRSIKKAERVDCEAGKLPRKVIKKTLDKVLKANNTKIGLMN